MMMVTGGRERTQAEYAALLAPNSFKINERQVRQQADATAFPVREETVKASSTAAAPYV